MMTKKNIIDERERERERKKLGGQRLEDRTRWGEKEKK